MYPINFTQPNKRFVEATASYLLLCLGNISKDFTINNMKKKTRLKGVANFFSVDFNPIFRYPEICNEKNMI